MGKRRLLTMTATAMAVAVLAAGWTTRTTSGQEVSRIKWRFRLAADYVSHRPGIGADGTIYVNDVKGHLYAINPDGTQKWVFQAGVGGGTYGPVPLGADGTIYVAALVPVPSGGATGGIYAVNPNGTQRWLFSGAGDTIVAGPNIGPDGNIYAVAEWPGIGLFSLTPSGTLRFARGTFSEYGSLGAEIVFGEPGQLYFAFDMSGLSLPALFGYTLAGDRRFEASAYGGGGQKQAATSPSGDVYVHTFFGGLGLGAYSPEGTLRWNFYEFPGNAQTHPDVGPDGIIYLGRNLSTLLAINANGTIRWRYQDPGILFDPIVSPQNTLILMGGRVNYGEPGFFAAVSPSGTLLWKVNLPVEPGFEPYGQIIPFSRPRFSPDGKTAYIATDVAGDGNAAERYSYLYAIDTSPEPAAGCAGTGSYSISGRTTAQVSKTSTGAPISGVTVSLSGAACTATETSDTTGSFRFSTLAPGTYTIVPHKDGCSFTPQSRSITLPGKGTAASFIGACQ